ncbi:TonB-dependent receptor [Sphingomonas sp. BIUV-7]|uniref:TonB-dependent receptor n=1 Tax=Sphingomonas natans TaxID=3063330 RepID=A0ABT8YAH3_9SPHN|nr:TonB-dependent receptor [Sphingomonas sp. BIUV-7]MDO6415331.1 TonB-dependent receptor [Sphingomonas sp. BIUV-7]
MVVTAQRRSESIQRVPVSVTAIAPEVLENRRLNDLTQITRVAPTLQTGLDNTFAIRGVGTTAFAGTIDSSVALAIDDVNYARPGLGGLSFNDVSGVEVLNGPQGLLFGKNASAGLLNISTVRPKIDRWEGITDIEVSNRATPGNDRASWGFQGRQTINVPVGETSALRLNGLYSYQDPVTRFVGTRGSRTETNYEQYSLKAKYLYEPSGGLSLYLIGDYNETHGVAGLYDSTYRQLDPQSIDRAPLAASGITAGPDNFQTAGEGGLWRDVKTGGAQGTIAYTLGSGIQISDIAAWRFYDQDQNNDADYTASNGASRNYTNAHYDQYSNELRIALPTQNRLSGQAGLYYFQSSLDTFNQIGGLNFLPAAAARGYPFCVGVTPVTGARPPVCSVNNDYFLGSDKRYTLDTKSYAAFGQLTFDITDALKAIAGGRVTRDELDIHLAQGQANYFTNLGGPRATIDQSYGNTNFSWKAGAQYQFTPVIMAYGFYGRGYKGPGFNDTAPNATASLAIRPEISNTAEIGLKSSFFNRKLVINVSMFHSKFDDFQVQSFDTILRAFFVQNAAKVTSKGIEANVMLAPVRGLTISATAAVLSSKFDTFPGAQCYPTQTSFGCSATVTTFNASGSTLPVSPKFTNSVDVLYEFPPEGGFKPFVGANWYHRSSFAYALNRAPGTIVGASDIFGANIGFALSSGVRMSLFCKNCTNQHIPSSIITEPGDAAARNAAGVATPRLSYVQQLGRDSVRIVGIASTFRF